MKNIFLKGNLSNKKDDFLRKNRNKTNIYLLFSMKGFNNLYAKY